MHGQTRLLGAILMSFMVAGCTSLKRQTSMATGGDADGAVVADSDAAAPRTGDGGPRGAGSGGRGAGTGGAAGPAIDGGSTDACERVTFYADADGDGYGDPATASSACEAPVGYVSDRSDCDDTCKRCHPGADEACDELDNNCDDTADEGCACEPGTMRACGEERGECEPGTQACSDGLWSDQCEGAIGPAASELCNGLDDDCNGEVDDGFPDLGEACTAGVGACQHAGTYVCAADLHDPPVCSATAGAAVTELCANLLDDDCDGASDEAPSATTCCIDEHCGATQRCSGGSCIDKIGCELKTRPSDVLPADYQCLDFDHGASLSPWTTVTANGGAIGVSMDQAVSGQSSIYPVLSGNTGSEGRLRWNAVGAKAIKSISLTASVHFPPVIGFHELWMGHDELLCIRYASSSYCVTYEYSDESNWGLTLEEVQTTSAVETHVCRLTTTPVPEDVWSRLELRVSSTGAPGVYLAGTKLASPDCVFTLGTTTSAASEVGVKQTAADETRQLYFDDIEVLVKR